MLSDHLQGIVPRQELQGQKTEQGFSHVHDRLTPWLAGSMIVYSKVAL